MQRAIPSGVAKIAFGTGLKNAFTHEGDQSMAAGDDIDLRRTFAPAIKAVEEVSIAKIRICSRAD
jgi:fructose/tagatose bisphosphate aldolase